MQCSHTAHTMTITILYYSTLMFWQKRLTNAKQLNKYNADDGDDETKVRVGDRGRKKEAKKIKIKIKKNTLKMAKEHTISMWRRMKCHFIAEHSLNMFECMFMFSAFFLDNFMWICKYAIVQCPISDTILTTTHIKRERTGTSAEKRRQLQWKKTKWTKTLRYA